MFFCSEQFEDIAKSFMVQLSPSSRGNTPLHVAAYWGNVEAAELLLSKGAAVDATNLAGPGPRRQRSVCQKSCLSNLGHLKKYFWGLKF